MGYGRGGAYACAAVEARAGSAHELRSTAALRCPLQLVVRRSKSDSKSAWHESRPFFVDMIWPQGYPT